MTIALVTGQTAHTSDSGPVTTRNVVLPNNPTAGNIVVVLCAFPSGNSITSIKDSVPNTYTAAATLFTANSNSVNIYYLPNVPSGATKTITITTSSVTGDWWAFEFSGVVTSSPLDGTPQTAAQPSGATYSTPSITPTVSGDLLVSVSGTNGDISGVNGSWIAASTLPTSVGMGGEYQILTGSGATATGFTLSLSNTGAGMIAAFKAAASTGPPVGVQNNDEQFLPFHLKFRDYFLQPYRSWEFGPRPTATVRSNFLNYDFPNPQAPQHLNDYTWIESGNNQPPFVTIKTTFQQNYWPLPDPGQRLNDYTWIESGNTQSPFPNLTKPFPLMDFPNPQPIYWYRSWEKWAQQTPTVKTTFQQNDWPLPQPVTWYRDWSFDDLVLNTLSTIQNPFYQTSWPVPPPVTWYQHWEYWTPPTPTVQTNFAQLDWPNPQPIYWYRDWSLNLQETTLAVPPQFPFNQYNWPNPLPVNWYQWWFNVQPFGTIQKPTAQYDWPLPYPVRWYEDWYQALAPYLPVSAPFNQTDWQNPKTWSPIDQWYFNNLILQLTAAAPKPFNQADWPLPRDYQRIDESFAQSLALILPPPPPPVVPTSAGRWISPEEVISSIARKYGRIGGLASADSRTAAERSLLASIAAAHRWKK